jgi:hypothetical protein
VLVFSMPFCSGCFQISPGHGLLTFVRRLMRVQGLGMRYEHDGCSDGPVCFLAGAGAGGKRKESAYIL